METVCSLEVDLRQSDAVAAMRVLAMKSEQIEEVVAWLSEVLRSHLKGCM